MEPFDELASLAREHGSLREDDLRALSERARIPLYRLQALASFFPHLGHPEAGRLRVCRDLSCRLAGADSLLKEAEAWAASRGLVVEPCSCLGRCDRAGAVVLEGETRDGLRPGGLAEALESPRPAEPEAAPSGFSLDPYPGPGQRFSALRQAVLEGDPAAFVDLLEQSGLKGMGGAGFPAGLKWKLVRAAAGARKHVVVNADESEPGTFKDRFLLRHFPHLMLEGALLGAWAVGADRVTVFVRHEYAEELAVLETSLAKARELGAVGPRIFGSSFGCEVRLFASPGGYICGEETALLEALSGRRAEPRNKPPFPGVRGLEELPTLINNVETLAWIPAIASRGPGWFAGIGAGGPKLVGLSGHVTRPGVVEARLGQPIRSLLEGPGGGVEGGRRLKAFSPGGASSGLLPAALIDLPYDFKSLAQAGSMLGSGALVFLAEGTCLVDAALSFARFFRDESCGKCVPCRSGTARLVDFLERATRGEAGAEEIPAVEELAAAMQAASICGLGQAAPLPVLSLLRHFREELLAHLDEGRCPEGVCPGRAR